MILTKKQIEEAMSEIRLEFGRASAEGMLCDQFEELMELNEAGQKRESELGVKLELAEKFIEACAKFGEGIKVGEINGGEYVMLDDYARTLLLQIQAGSQKDE